MDSSSTALIIFIKNAELGKVKTRLAKTVGDEKALAIYLSLLKHTRELATQVSAHRFLFYSQSVDTKDQWDAKIFDKRLQSEGDLGRRMKAAFELAFKEHDQVIIIGSDCPGLSVEIVQEAFQALRSFPFVIGPAMDGGYYLIGMNTYQAQVFEDIDWSTEQVFNQTMERIKDLDQSCYLLPELSDIDYEEDWKEHGWEL